MEHFTSEELIDIHGQIQARWFGMSREEWEIHKDTLRKFLNHIENILHDRRKHG